MKHDPRGDLFLGTYACYGCLSMFTSLRWVEGLKDSKDIETQQIADDVEVDPAGDESGGETRLYDTLL